MIHSSLETELEHKAVLNFKKKKCLEHNERHRTAGVPGYAVTLQALPILRREVYSPGTH